MSGTPSACDILVVGSGAGGLSAALTAAHSGADVLVIESADKIGGAAAYSGGQVWAGNTDQAVAAGVADSPAEVSAYLEWLSEGRALPAHRSTFVDRGPEAIRFLVGQGVPLRLVRNAPDYYFPIAAGSKAEGRIHEIEPWDDRQLGALADRVALSPYGAGWLSTQDRVDAGGQAPTAELVAMRRAHVERHERCGGQGLAAALAKAAVDAGARALTATRAMRLTQTDGRVDGAVVSGEGGQHRITARHGVILATGGYDWNPEYLRELDDLVGLRSMAPATTTGDHVELAREVGGRMVVVRTPRTSGAVFGTHTPGEVRDGRDVYRYFTPGLPGGIVVNSRGRRFADDSFHMSLVAGIVGGADGESNWPAWAVVDGRYLADYGMGAVGPGDPVPDGMATVAQTLDELGRATGIDPEGLAAEVERFNGFASAGSDPDFGRGSLPYTRTLHGDPRYPNPNLRPLSSPPYWAFALTRVGVNCPAAGLATGLNGEVENEDGGPIPGLYAAGNCSAQRDIGAGYNSGMGNQRGLLYGYLAARAIVHAAAR